MHSNLERHYLRENPVSVLLAIGCLILFVAGIYCYPLAFQMETDMLSMLVFFAGLALNTLAFFIPWQVLGHSRK